ncbi:MAG: GTP-binding protein [Terriglobus roseus]|nr:GTP-binding protein [Terriglobus roseus]
MSAVQQSGNYDYLRRKGSSVSVAAVGGGRQQRGPRAASERASNGTVSSSVTASTGRESAATQLTALTEPPAYSKKFVVVGDGGCGKTCLLISYSQGYFPEVRFILFTIFALVAESFVKMDSTDWQQKYVPTVFENYITQTPHAPSGKTVELALWDTAGQEEYDRLRPLSYPETDLVFVCFAIDCPNSLENVADKWHPEVLHFLPSTPVLLLGLKSDLRHKKTCIDLLKTQGLTPVTPEQGRAQAARMGARYMECSSKEMDGVEDIFDTAVSMAVAAEEEAREVFDKERPASSRAGNGRKSGLSGSSGAKSRRSAVKKSCKIL